MKDRKTGGKGRVPAGHPAQIACTITLISGNAAAGRKKTKVMRSITRVGYLEVVTEVVTLVLSATCDFDLEGLSVGVESHSLGVLYLGIVGFGMVLVVLNKRQQDLVCRHR